MHLRPLLIACAGVLLSLPLTLLIPGPHTVCVAIATIPSTGLRYCRVTNYWQTTLPLVALGFWWVICFVVGSFAFEAPRNNPTPERS